MRAATTLFGLVLAGCSGAGGDGVPASVGATPTGDAAAASIPDADADAGATRPEAPPDAAIEASTPPPTRDAASPCSGAVVCDDFEQAPVGGPPLAPTWAILTPDCSGSGTVAVDDTQAHGGSRSVKVTGAAGYCNHVFFGTSAVANLPGTVWVRFYVRLDTPLGDGHTTFLAMHDAHDGKDLRMGGQDGVLMYNRESDDATLPAMSPAGVAQSLAPAAHQWRCVEAAIDGATRSIRTWVDGNPVAGLIVDGTPTPDVDAPWLASSSWAPKLMDARFGWESYAGQADTLWFDDVAIGPARIGC